MAAGDNRNCRAVYYGQEKGYLLCWLNYGISPEAMTAEENFAHRNRYVEHNIDWGSNSVEGEGVATY